MSVGNLPAAAAPPQPPTAGTHRHLRLPQASARRPPGSQVTPAFLGGRGVEHRRPDPGIPEAAITAALCPRRSGLPAPAPSPSAAAWPPSRPPARSRTRPCSPWPRPPPGGPASKPLPRAPAPPTHRPARPPASPRLPVRPRRLAWPRPPELGRPRPLDHAPRCVHLAWRGAWTPSGRLPPVGSLASGSSRCAF